VAAATWVTNSAMPALASAAKALPALKPNQPTHSMAVPAMVSPGLCAGRSCCGWPLRRPSMVATTNAETPAVVWTTKPPAKSITPSSASQPPPHTQWATGE